MIPSEMDKVKDGDVLVIDMTDPDWEPVMKRASAIIARVGVPAIVGTGNASTILIN